MSKAKVLCIDDDQTVARMVGRMVEFAGCEPVFCFDAIEAAAKYLRDASIRAVFADYMMPRMDGIELLDLFQESRPDVRRILVTAAPQESAVREAERSGVVQRVIEKPPSLADVENALAWL